MQLDVNRFEEVLKTSPFADIAEQLIEILRESYAFGCPARRLPDLVAVSAGVFLGSGGSYDIYVGIVNQGTWHYVPGNDPVEVVVEVMPVTDSVRAGGRNFLSLRFQLDEVIPPGGAYNKTIKGVTGISPSFSPSGLPGNDGVVPGSASVVITVCVDPANQLVELRKDNNDLPPGAVVVAEVRPVPSDLGT